MELLELLVFAFMATIKFAVLVPLYIVKKELPFWQGMLFGVASGITGILFFMFLSSGMLLLWEKMKKVLFPKRKPQAKFSKKNRRIVLFKAKYGLWGIAFLSPFFLSLPLGTFLAVRYYKNRWRIFKYMTAGVLFWSFIYAAFGTYLLKFLNYLSV